MAPHTMDSRDDKGKSDNFVADSHHVQPTSVTEEEEESLLPSGNAFFQTPKARTSKQQIFNIVLPWLINVSLLTAVLYLWTSGSRDRCFESSPDDASAYSPAEEASEYSPVIFSQAFGHESSPYQGWPNDEQDKLWQDLYSDGISIHISESSHGKLINKSQQVPLPGYKHEYMVGLGVFHQIHCLNMLRMQIYPGRYNTSMAKPDGTVDYIQWLHTDHCIEALRQALVCHSDITAIPFTWSEKSKLMAAGMGTTHMCRNFSKVREWAFDRTLDWKTPRAHVEHGYIVDYSSWELDPEETYFLRPPEDWVDHTVDDL